MSEWDFSVFLLNLIVESFFFLIERKLFKIGRIIFSQKSFELNKIYNIIHYNNSNALN